MTLEVIIVLVALVAMLTALIMDKMRPGMILFSVVVIFLCTGILSPKEMLEGFSNKGMITVAMLFLVSEGIRQSGALTQVIKKLLPQSQTTVFKAQARMLPTIAFISAFLNNTPVVVIFAPIIKRWANYVKLPATYSDTSVVCNYPGRYLYTDRYFNQPGSTQYDTRSRNERIQYVRARESRYFHSHCRHYLPVPFL